MCRDIGDALKITNKKPLIVCESTVVPGTTSDLIRKIIEQNSGKSLDNGDFYLGFSPERVEPFNELNYMAGMPKVMGGLNQKSTDLIKLLYTMILPSSMLDVTDAVTAEVTKVAENAFRSVNIAHANYATFLAEALNLDIDDILWSPFELPDTSPFLIPDTDEYMRNLKHYMEKPGIRLPGFEAGHCLTKDLLAFVYAVYKKLLKNNLFVATRELNAYPARHMFNMTNKSFGDLKHKNVAIMGIGFKRDTKDLRNSQAIPLINDLENAGANVIIIDPYAEEKYFKFECDEMGYPDVKETPIYREIDKMENCDAAVIITGHTQFIEMDIEEFNRLNVKKVLDGRRIYEHKDMEEAGIHYETFGGGKGEPLMKLEEAIKLIDDCHDAVNAAFTRETALYCEKLGANIEDVTKFMNKRNSRREDRFMWSVDYAEKYEQPEYLMKKLRKIKTPVGLDFMEIVTGINNRKN